MHIEARFHGQPKRGIFLHRYARSQSCRHQTTPDGRHRPFGCTTWTTVSADTPPIRTGGSGMPVLTPRQKVDLPIGSM